MNKTIKALLMGYVLFRVNGRKFWRYTKAEKARVETVGNVQFDGLHIWRGWECFFLRIGFVDHKPELVTLPPACEHCDDTGDVHGLDGEWRGYCTCKAGFELSGEHGA